MEDYETLLQALRKEMGEVKKQLEVEKQEKEKYRHDFEGYIL